MKLKRNIIKNEDTEKDISSLTTPEHHPSEESDIESDTDALRIRIEELEAENKAIKEALAEKKNDYLMEQTVRSWIKDGEFLKENYPDFNLEAEAENPAFLNLLRGGADLKSAYLAMHHDEIVKSLIEKAVSDAKLKTAEAIKARGKRPLENGMSGKSTALFKTDVSKLTPAQRAEIATRVARGETITF
ncbi:MAG: hypothetical protein II998_02095 [Clostridia bacterium]|nr:hypothetical protein [Clostridia bacterium]